MDKRRRNQANVLAKKRMVAALMQLLKEKPLSAVTVSELTEKAGVSRMTYYRNYQKKEDIFSCYLEDVLADYKEESVERHMTANCYDMDNLVHCFSYFKEHRAFVDTMFVSGLGHIFLKAISDYVLEMWQNTEDDVRHYYGLQAFSGALYNLFLTWSMGGAKEEPEELAGILHEVFRRLA